MMAVAGRRNEQQKEGTASELTFKDSFTFKIKP